MLTKLTEPLWQNEEGGEVRSRSRPGLALIWVTVGMTLFCAVCMLAVDYARYQLVKTELHGAATAAARAGASGLSDSTAYTRATYVASQNQADGQPLTLTTSGADPDVVTGRWDTSTKQFAADSTPTNAVRVTARRTAARGNAVKLAFGQVLGIAQQDVSCAAVAVLVPALEQYGVIGLDYVKLSGNNTTAYWSTTGTVDTTKGNVASNGDITLEGSSYVYGNARPGPGKTVVGAAGRVSGSTTPLSSPLNYPNASPASYATSNNNGQVPAGFLDSSSKLHVGSGNTCNLPGGTYYFGEVLIDPSGTLNFTGPATVYCYKNVVVKGQVNTASGIPANLKLILGTDTGGSSAGTFETYSSASTYATLYAPQSAVKLFGSGSFYGSVLGWSVEAAGSSQIYYDMTLGASTSNAISLVQ